MSSSPRIKILLVGTIGDNVDEFVKKIKALQQSKAGPFDACFCVGRVSPSILSQTDLPLPIYLQDASGITEEEGLVELAPNLHALGGAQVVSIDVKSTPLVVASCPPRVQWDSNSTQALKETLSHVSYVGCDLLLTSEWPQGIEHLLGLSSTNEGSYDVAEVALRARPRYHVAPGHGAFIQSPPFRHLAATSSTFAPKHVGRFLALEKVVSPSESKAAGKSAKFVHALGLTPLQYMTANELQTTQSVQACPYTDESYQPDGTSASNVNVGLSEAQARRLLSEGAQHGGGDSHARWISKKRPQESADAGEVDTSNTTLFLHGLHKDVRGMLQTGSGALLEAFAPFQIERVVRPPAASSYAFLEFPSHQLAKDCLEKCGGKMVVAGIHLTLKWKTDGGKKDSNAARPAKRQRLTEAEAMDSSTIFYRLPAKILIAEFKQATEDLRTLMEKSLEHALSDPDVTAATEPALQVKARPIEDKNYGFLEFASHAAASMALATMTGSTDGGLLHEGSEVPPPTGLLGVVLSWAQDARPPSDEKDGGLKFQQKHFPPDARKDCWFCLASPTCEKHLIASVHNECYIAMPKGPVHPEGHVLIIPVTHSGKGALVDRSVASEMEELKQRLRKHASDVWQMDLFVFERAIQTKGGYHTHVQCIPIERGLGIKLQATMVARARSIPGFDLREINSDIGLAAMVSDDSEDDGGYFYAEVPFSRNEFKRFLYKAQPTGEEDRRGQTVPLQFGREVLASVMDKPELAHWKACVLDEEKETELANAFRDSFAKYDDP